MRRAHEIAQLRPVASGLCLAAAILGCTNKSSSMMVAPTVYWSTTADLGNVTTLQGRRSPDAESAIVADALGHFRLSPWVGHESLLVLALELNPNEHCLYRVDGDPVWRFPDNSREQFPTRVDDLKRGHQETSE